MAEPNVEVIDTEHTAAGQDFLTVHLNSQLKEWVEARRPQEEIFRQNYMDRMRMILNASTSLCDL